MLIFFLHVFVTLTVLGSTIWLIEMSGKTIVAIFEIFIDLLKIAYNDPIGSLKNILICVFCLTVPLASIVSVGMLIGSFCSGQWLF